MNEERGISMNEFKTMFESIQSSIKAVVEVMNHRFDRLEKDMHTVKTEIALLHEGQTEIKAELRSGLKERVTYQDFNKLDKRVARLERKTA
jgi:hypothetical protein